MSRASSARVKISLISGVVVLAVAGSVSAYALHRPVRPTQPPAALQQQASTQFSYHGQNGVDALTLLKQHAAVETKHYSFGDLVTSINGTAGNGPKYWTFYINGKEASVGAGSYQTKSSDTLTWRLQ